jgi:glc operon protein GlcG
MNILRKSLVTFAGTLVFASQAIALNQKLVMDLETAQIMAEACLAHQIATQYKPINVVIVDDGGNVILINRQDGACKACGDIAESKARTAALFDNTTRGFETLSYGPAKDGVAADLPGIALVPGLIAFPGGVPIHAGGTVIGGIGVSGASGDEDEQCALAGIAAVEALLK